MIEDVYASVLQEMAASQDWTSVLPSPIASICTAIANGDQHYQLPLTVNHRRQLLPLSTLCTLEPMPVLPSHRPLVCAHLLFTLWFRCSLTLQCYNAGFEDSRFWHAPSMEALEKKPVPT